MKTILIHNNKGGVGKSTVAVFLAHYLAKVFQLRVGLIDMDGQANATEHLSLTPTLDRPSVLDVMLGEAALADAFVPTEIPGLLLLPANEDLAAADTVLAGQTAREGLLRAALEEGQAAEMFDVLVLDMSPSLGTMWANAALASTGGIVIPTELETFSVAGVIDLVKHMRALERPLRHKFDVRAIVPTKLKRRKASTELLADLRGAFGDLVTAPLPDSAKVPEAQSDGRTLLTAAPRAKITRDFSTVAEEIATRLDILPAIFLPSTPVVQETR